MCEEEGWTSQGKWERMIWDVGGERGKKRDSGSKE
jgi:hypothetical protein